ncbi:MAG: glycoside hydrolase domain-containing protein, partial [Armatimonadota bacterium]
VFHRLRSGETVADPLPEMGQAKIVSVPPGESRQIWLTLNTENLPPGEYTSTITFMPFDPDLPKTQIPVNMRVRPVRLLDHMPILTYHWDYFSRDYSEAYVRNLADHYVNCFSMKTRHVFPEYDTQGNIVKKYDWSSQDRVLHTKLHYARKSGGLIVYSYGVAYDFDRYSNRYGWEFMSEPYKRAFAAHLREFERHLRDDIGISHDEYVVQIWDEAHHRGQGEKAVRMAQFMREIVPEMQTCMDGGPPIEDLPEVNPLVDSWIPHMAHLWDDGVQPEVQRWKDTGKPVCTYTTAHPKKALDPHGYFRLQPWKVWQLGLDGDFYWGVYSYGTDIWNDFDGNRHDNVVVYPSPEGPVTSRRWEATREGREDYIALHILREAGRDAGGERQQHIERAIQDMVDTATLTADDLETFAGVSARLGDMLETEIGGDLPALMEGPEFSREGGDIRATWTTDRPTSGRLMYRVPGFDEWNHADVQMTTEHSVLLENLPASRSFEWYLLHWAENRAAGACLDGLSSRHWFRTPRD